jgi:hypothetical protein
MHEGEFAVVGLKQFLEWDILGKLSLINTPDTWAASSLKFQEFYSHTQYLMYFVAL